MSTEAPIAKAPKRARGVQPDLADLAERRAQGKVIVRCY